MVKKLDEIGERTGRPPSDETKAKLIDTARREFEVKGVAATSMRSIRLQAGVSNGSVYHFFPGGKADLATLIYKEWSEELLGKLSASSGKTYASVPALLEKELLGPYIAWFRECRGRAAFMLQMEAGPPNGDARMAITAAKLGLQTRLRDLLKASGKLSRLTDIPVARLSAMVFGPAHQTLEEWARTETGLSEPAEMVRSIAETAADSLLTLNEATSAAAHTATRRRR